MNLRNLLLLLSLFLLSCKENFVEEENFSKLGFSASGCFGTCPIMRVEIDNNKNYYFHGIRFTDKIGYYKGELPDSLYKVFISNLEKVKNYKLKPNETRLEISDAPVYDFKILSNNGTEIKHEILLEDDDLTRFLLTSYKKINLSKTDTLKFITKVKI